MAAFSKGWSLFSSVVASATQAVNENVIQPGMERVMDPEFQANVRGYATEAGKRATQVGAAANEWGRTQFGVDVGSQVSGVMGSMGRDRTGYGALSQEAHGSNGRYNDSDPEDDFFGQFEGSSSSSQQQQTSATRAAPAPVTAAPVQAAKKDDDWDDWKDF
jgi:ADP-ribosylation factor GTPase-activating protein 1